VAIYQLRNFVLAAAPAVAFLSVATAVTGLMFLRHRQRHRSAGATVLGVTFLLWAVHHLDYTILRARGVWTPWGYYLDILFTLAVGAGILLLINSELTERLQARSEELELLSRRMVRQHEEERRRLSLALHDETAQALAALKLQLGSVAERVEPPLRQRVERSLALVDSSLTGIRNLTNALRPSLLDDLGLAPALRSLVAEFTEQQGRQVGLIMQEPLPIVAEEAEVVLYRALQEGLSNAVRHAGPSVGIGVSLGIVEGLLELRLVDNGPGFDVATLPAIESSGHLGLAGMRERAAAVGGALQIESQPGAGTTLRVRVPVLEGVAA
jgi:signal transduction histidine kinase